MKASIQSKEALSPLFLSKKTQFSSLPAKSSKTNSMAISLQEQFRRNTTFSSSKKSSSPTALGLLLRSSVFKELVEKNLNLSEEESDDEKTNLQHSNGGGDMFYNLPFSLSPNNHWIELQG